MKQLTKDAVEILTNKRDKLVKTFADTNANFVAACKEARKIIDHSYIIYQTYFLSRMPKVCCFFSYGNAHRK
jgi:hypothetical protein